jgi:hypothetical protein
MIVDVALIWINGYGLRICRGAELAGGGHRAAGS